MNKGFHSTRRFRNFVFTLNNPTEEEREAYLALQRATFPISGMKYIVVQEELSTSGTVHFQGYAELSIQRTLTALKNRLKIYFGRAHIENRRGTQEQAIQYAKKDDTRIEGGLSVEAGTKNASGTRKSSYKQLAKAILNGENPLELEEEFPGLHLQNRQKINDYILKKQGKRRWPMKIVIFYGNTGAGKSCMANMQYPDAYNVPWPTGGRWWWPNYKGEETVIMDEFRHQIKMDVMLKMMDRYAWQLERKGGNMQFCSKRIVITTNIDPRDWYPGVSLIVKSPLRRRINEFAEIWDFMDGEYPHFSMTKRQEEFKFNQTFNFQAAQNVTQQARVDPYNM